MARMLWAVMAMVLVHGAQADPMAFKWNVDQVCRWAFKAGLGQDVVVSLRALGVDGVALLHMEVKDIKEDLGITDANLVLKMHSAIEELEDHFTHKPKLNFWQYRSLNRNAMDSFVPGISGFAPRFALRILDEFPAPGQPSEQESWTIWLFCPQYYIYMNADKIVGGLPFFVKFACLTSLIGQILGLLMCVSGQSSWGIWFALTVGVEICMAIVLTVYRWLIYPIIPWFISDFIFFFNVYVMSCIVLGAYVLLVLSASVVGKEVFGVF